MIKFINNVLQSVDLSKRLLSIENQIIGAADILIESVNKGGCVFVAGNGGAASNASHFTAELLGRFYKERKAIPSVCLGSDISTITALTNDYGFDSLYERQLEGLFNPEKDIFIGMSTSGNSENIIRATEYLNEIGGKSIILLGKDGGKNIRVSNDDNNIIFIKIPSDDIPRIQEAHLFILHYFAEKIEENMELKYDN